jgi:hypothetical protein
MMKKRYHSLWEINSFSLFVVVISLFQSGCSEREGKYSGVDPELVALLTKGKTTIQDQKFKAFIESPQAEMKIRDSLKALKQGGGDYMEVYHYLGYVNPEEYLQGLFGMIDAKVISLGVVNTHAIKFLSPGDLERLILKLEGSEIENKDDWLKTLTSLRRLRARDK